MKIKRIVTAAIFAAILISIGSCVHKCVNHLSHLRKFNDISPSNSIEESRSRHAFMFEYEPQSTFVYDSIPIRVKKAWAEHCMWYKDWESDSIVISSDKDAVVLIFEKDPWPGYYGDSVTMSTENLFISWMIGDSPSLENSEKRKLIIEPFENGHDVPAPDTLNLFITELIMRKDSVESYHDGYMFHRTHSHVREDTIGMLQFIRKKE